MVFLLNFQPDTTETVYACVGKTIYSTSCWWNIMIHSGVVLMDHFPSPPKKSLSVPFLRESTPFTRYLIPQSLVIQISFKMEGTTKKSFYGQHFPMFLCNTNHHLVLQLDYHIPSFFPFQDLILHGYNWMLFLCWVDAAATGPNEGATPCDLAALAEVKCAAKWQKGRVGGVLRWRENRMAWKGQNG